MIRFPAMLVPSPRLHLSYWPCILRPMSERDGGRARAAVVFSTSPVSGWTILWVRIRSGIPPFHPGFPGLPRASLAAPAPGT